MLTRFWPARLRRLTPAPVIAQDIKLEIVKALMARDLPAANLALSHAAPGGSVQVTMDSAVTPGAAVLHWTLCNNHSTLAFHESAYEIVPHLIFGRLMDFLPIVLKTMEKPKVQGHCYLNVGDEGHAPGLASCANHADYGLIPDCIFLAWHGYAGLAGQFAAAAVPYAARAPVAFWRGASTGVRTGGVMDLPRVQLCRMGMEMGAKADIGISKLVNIRDEEAQALIDAGVIREEAPMERLDHYQVHVDIDGNSNSWTGLLTKLHSGGPVLKVESPWGFRQWYYDRLVPWENYIPVRSDMSDLEDKIDHLLSHPQEAEAIGARGRALALSMTYDREVAWAAPVAAAALAKGKGRPRQGTGLGG